MREGEKLAAASAGEGPIECDAPTIAAPDTGGWGGGASERPFANYCRLYGQRRLRPAA